MFLVILFNYFIVRAEFYVKRRLDLVKSDGVHSARSHYLRLITQPTNTSDMDAIIPVLIVCVIFVRLPAYLSYEFI